MAFDLKIAAAAAAGAAIPHAVSLAGQWIAARGGHAQARAARAAAERAARATFEDKALEAQRAAHTALISAAHAIAEKMPAAFDRAVNERAQREDPGFSSSAAVDLIPGERSAFRLALSRVELEGPNRPIDYARRIDTAIRRAERKCSAALPLLGAVRRLELLTENPDVDRRRGRIARSALSRMRMLGNLETPSLSLEQRRACREIVKSEVPGPWPSLDSDRMRESQDAATAAQQEHPEEYEALHRRLTAALYAVGRLSSEDVIHRNHIRHLRLQTLRMRMGRERVNLFDPWRGRKAPWESVDVARLAFTDVAREYLHTMPTD